MNVPFYSNKMFSSQIIINFSVVHNAYAIRLSVSSSHYCNTVVLTGHVDWQPPMKLDATFFFFLVGSRQFRGRVGFLSSYRKWALLKRRYINQKLICTQVREVFTESGVSLNSPIERTSPIS